MGDLHAAWTWITAEFQHLWTWIAAFGGGSVFTAIAAWFTLSRTVLREREKVAVRIDNTDDRRIGIHVINKGQKDLTVHQLDVLHRTGPLRVRAVVGDLVMPALPVKVMANDTENLWLRPDDADGTHDPEGPVQGAFGRPIRIRIKLGSGRRKKSNRLRVRK